ncbi:MAG: glycosyltransferase family 39 protein [Candidatus Aenigmarchaeota archaeon]|nr:glycosyltransferase family 39 protein [Candidatus Aenigmarchaeota archaeon]
MDLFSITFILPLTFLISFFIVNFYFIKILYNRINAYIVTCFLLTFAPLWRWGQYVLVDVPFAVFGILSLILFYLAVEKRKKWYLVYSFIAFSFSFLIKISATAILIIFILYLIYRKKTSIIISREFLIGFIISFIIILIPIFWVYSISGSEFLRLDILNFVFASESQEFIVNFLLSPIVIFLPFGIPYIIKKRTKEHVLLLITFLVFLIIFNRVALIRYFTMIFSIVFIFSLFGFFWIKEKIKIKKIFEILLILFLVASFLNSIYLLQINLNTNYGVKDLSDYVEKNLNGTISAGSLSGYIGIYTTKDIAQIPHLVKVKDTEITFDEWYNVVVNKSHSLNAYYIESTKNGTVSDRFYFDDDWVNENNVSYVVLSIYDEFLEHPVEKYYNIFYSGIEIPIKRNYLWMRPPPDYKFNSELYHHIETSNMYRKTKEINKGNQTVFIIYEVII